jgi:hypothetical protein
MPCDRLLTGWSLVRIRPGEPSNLKGLNDYLQTPAKAKISRGQHLGQQSARVVHARSIMPLGFMSDEQIRARLEELGVSQVKTLVATGGLPTTWNLKVAKWLAEKEEEALAFAAHAFRYR